MNCQMFSTGFNSGARGGAQVLPWDDEFLAGVPAGLIEENHRMGVGIDGRGPRPDARSWLALFTDGPAAAFGRAEAPKYARPICRALVVRQGAPGAPNLVFLRHAGA